MSSSRTEVAYGQPRPVPRDHIRGADASKTSARAFIVAVAYQEQWVPFEGADHPEFVLSPAGEAIVGQYDLGVVTSSRLRVGRVVHDDTSILNER